MALSIQKLLELARFARNLGGILDLEALAALVKAVLPLPATDADVSAWLARVGVTTPLAPVAQGILAKFLPDVIPAPQLDLAIMGDATPDVALPALPTIMGVIDPLRVSIVEQHPDGISNAELEAYGDTLTAQAVPVWVIPLVLEILKLLAAWRKNRQ